MSVVDTACPGGRYLAEIVTANGLTSEHPTTESNTLFDWSRGESDYAQWASLGNAVLGSLEKSWVLLSAWPGTKGMPASEYNALTSSLVDIRSRYAAMRKPWTSNAGSSEWRWGDAADSSAVEITAMTRVVIDAQCLRQRIDETLAAYGGKPDPPGDTAHKPPKGGLGILGTLALVVGSGTIATGAILLARKIGRSAT